MAEFPDVATLERDGILVVDQINHREYVYRGRRFFVCWDSKRPHPSPEGWEPAWHVYRAEPEVPHGT